MDELMAGGALKDRGWQAQPEDQRTIAQLFCDQVEFANVIVVNKCDLLDDAGRSQLHAFLKRANPKAKVVESTYGRVDPKTLLGTNLFSLSQAEQHPDWLKEARIGEHTAETEEYGISSIVFRNRKPLDAGRLSMFFHAHTRDGLPAARVTAAQGRATIEGRTRRAQEAAQGYRRGERSARGQIRQKKEAWEEGPRLRSLPRVTIRES